jgi:hypothetical protein
MKSQLQPEAGIAIPASHRASSQSGVTNQTDDNQIEGVSCMARIIEFHIPVGFNPTTKYVPPQARSALIAFPPDLTRSASDASALNSEMTQQMNTKSMELNLIWPPHELVPSMR